MEFWGRNSNHKRKIFNNWLILCLNKLDKQSLWIKKNDLKGQDSFIFFYFVFNWQSLPPPSFKRCSVTLFSSEKSLFIPLWENYYYINIVNIKNLGFNIIRYWYNEILILDRRIYFTSCWDIVVHMYIFTFTIHSSILWVASIKLKLADIW